MSDAPIVIVGTGLAGYSLAREVRRIDADVPLHIVTSDGGESYSKPMISNALAKGQTAADLPMATVEKQATDLNAEIWTRRRVTAVDTAEHRLAIGDDSLAYGKLVLAIGADPIRLPLADEAPVASINDLDDYARFRERIDGVSRIAILGAGLIGCEFANDLVSTGREVRVVEPFEHSLGRLVPSPPARAVERALAAAGVDWHFGVTCEDAAESGGGLSLRLSDGSEIDAEVILSAVGLRPRTGLAGDAGLALNRGIVVDRALRTSDPDVFALGDCMEVEGLVLPFIMPIMHCARALAKTLTGTETALRYPAMPVVVKTPAHPVVVSPPAPDHPGEWRVEETDDGVKALFVGDGDALLGFTITGAFAKERAALAKQLPPILE